MEVLFCPKFAAMNFQKKNTLNFVTCVCGSVFLLYITFQDPLERWSFPNETKNMRRADAQCWGDGS